MSWAWNRNKRTKRDTFPIKRQNEMELNQAIADLQARGFEVVNRGVNDRTKKHFVYRDNHGPKNRFIGDEHFQIHWAIMRKVESA